MRLDILILNSSLPDWIKELILMANTELIELPWGYFNKWEYLVMHQLQPVVEKDPQSMKEINQRLDWVMKNEKM